MNGKASLLSLDSPATIQLLGYRNEATPGRLYSAVNGPGGGTTTAEKVLKIREKTSRYWFHSAVGLNISVEI
jgi:hypothetical protein